MSTIAQRLETDSASMKQLDDELVQVKRQLSQKSKENAKLNKELETLNTKRDQAQARIGKYFLLII